MPPPEGRMPMPLLAHSARPERGIPVQRYTEHIQAVFQGAAERVARVAGYSATFGAFLRSTVENASLWHDLGKLEAENQTVLASVSRRPLPLNHCDAGVAHLLTLANGNAAKA